MSRRDDSELFGYLFGTMLCCYTHCYTFYSLQYYKLEPLGTPSYSDLMPRFEGSEQLWIPLPFLSQSS